MTTRGDHRRRRARARPRDCSLDRHPSDGRKRGGRGCRAHPGQHHPTLLGKTLTRTTTFPRGVIPRTRLPDAALSSMAPQEDIHWTVDGAPYGSRFATPGAWKRGRADPTPYQLLHSRPVLVSPQYAYTGRTGKVTAHIVPGGADALCSHALLPFKAAYVLLAHCSSPCSRTRVLGPRLRSSMCH